MDEKFKSISDIRRENLFRIIKEHQMEVPGATERDVAAHLGIDYAQINLAKGKRKIGNRLAQRIEAGAGKPVNWMDNLHDQQKLPDDIYRALTMMLRLDKEDWVDVLRLLVDKLSQRNGKK